MRLNLRGLRACFISAFIAMILSLNLGLAQAGESPSTPWGIIVSEGLGPDCVFDYYSSAGAAEAAAKGRLGPVKYLGTSIQNNGTPIFGFTFIHDTDNNCTVTGASELLVGYAGNNYGETCPDGSYHENGGGSCPAYNPPPKANGNPCRTGGCGVGEPIDTASGNVYEEVTDYKTAGANNLDFTRYYNSLATATTYAVSLGSHWRTNYDRYLTVVSGTSVTVERADGQGLSFTYNGSAWVTDSDIDMTLTHTGSGTGSTWTLKDRNDVTETYTQLASREGQLNSIKARNGYTQTLTYTSNQLTKVTDSFSRTLNITYLSSGFINTVTTPDGLVLTYNYNASGLHGSTSDRLAGVSYSTTPVKNQSYSYAANAALPFLLNGITDENGALYASWTYDSAGRGLSSQFGAGADLATLSYLDGFNNTDGTGPTVTNALGQQELYRYATLQGLSKIVEIDRLATSTVPAITETFTYDGNGYLASKTDWRGYGVNYVNNSHGDPTSITEVGDGGNAPTRTTTIAYDPAWVHLPKTITAPRKTTAFTYDANGNALTRTETDTTGGVTNGQTRTWTYTYDSFGHKLTETGPRTDVTATTTYTYTADNLSTITDALGNISRITSYNGSGLPLTMTDPNGIVHSFTYDIRDRLLTATVQAASGNATTTLGYDYAGNLNKVTLPNGSYLAYSYDTAHRLTRITDNTGEYIQYARDANGDVTQTQNFNSTGTLVKTQTAVFDSLGRVLQQIGASNQTITNIYDNNGNLNYVTDALGNERRNDYDGFNRLINIVDNYGIAVVHGFDPQDNLIRVVDAIGLGADFTFDGFGEVLTQALPQSGTFSTTTYTLDKVGNRVSETDGRGIVTNRTFDKLNRVLTETYPASPGENIAYSYDATANGNFGIGHLTGFTDESGSTAFTYNERGDIITDKRVIAGVAYTTTYTYDMADNLATITYPSGHIITYSRDTVGRISGITYKVNMAGVATNLVTNVLYKSFGNYYTLTYGNGLVRTLTYDQDYRLTGIAVPAVQSLTVGYDAANDIKTIADALDSTRNQTFGYDKDYRLTSATGKYGTLGYTYDNNGGKLTKVENGATSTYNHMSWPGVGPTNQYANITTGGTVRSFTYTPDGNITTDSGDATFTYSNRNRLKQSVNTASQVSTYLYNAKGERVQRVANGAVKQFLYDPQGHLTAEYGSGGALFREYVYLQNEPVAQIEIYGNNLFYIHPDQTGTPQKMTDPTKAIIWDRVQKPFGDTYSTAGAVAWFLRFPGQYADALTTTSQNGFRDYDPAIGYIEADPIALDGGTNLYAYVDNNPVNWIDPEGLYHYLPGAGEPVDTKTANLLTCMDTCLKTDLAVSGAKEGGHSPGSAHETGQACDISKRHNPSINRDDVAACFAKCASDSSYGQEEKSHYHLQTRPGKGNATGFAPGVH